MPPASANPFFENPRFTVRSSSQDRSTRSRPPIWPNTGRCRLDRQSTHLEGVEGFLIQFRRPSGHPKPRQGAPRALQRAAILQYPHVIPSFEPRLDNPRFDGSVFGQPLVNPS